MCTFEADGSCAVWVETVVTARKEHACTCCGGTIRKGAVYTKHFSIYDGYASNERMCYPCSVLVEAFHKEHGSRVSPGGMRDVIVECSYDGEEGSDRWARAAAQMGRRWDARKRRLAQRAAAVP